MFRVETKMIQVHRKHTTKLIKIKSCEFYLKKIRLLNYQQPRLIIDKKTDYLRLVTVK